MRRDHRGLVSPNNSEAVNRQLAELAECGTARAWMNGVWVAGALLKGLHPNQIRYYRCKNPTCRRCMRSKKKRNVPWKTRALKDLVKFQNLHPDHVSWVTLGDHVQAPGSDFSQAAQEHRNTLRNLHQRKLKVCQLILYADLSESPAGLKLHWHGLVSHPGMSRERLQDHLRSKMRADVDPLYSDDLELEMTRCLRYAQEINPDGLTEKEFLELLESIASILGPEGRGQRLSMGFSNTKSRRQDPVEVGSSKCSLGDVLIKNVRCTYEVTIPQTDKVQALGACRQPGQRADRNFLPSETGISNNLHEERPHLGRVEYILKGTA